MDFNEVNKKRFSCRSFLDKKVLTSTLCEIVGDAILAPSAVNYQPTRFIIVENEDLIEKFKEASKYIFNAKSLIVLYYDSNVSWKRGRDGKDYGIVDASLCAQNLMLSVTNHKLGTVFVGSFNEGLVKNILGLGETDCVVGIFPIGYIKEGKEHGSRYSIDDLCTIIK